MSDDQATAYTRYRNANTSATLRESLNDDFVEFINDWTLTTPESVDTSHLPRLSYSKEQFYRLLVSSTLHNTTYNGVDIVTFSYDAATSEYVITHRLMNAPKREYRLNSAYYIPNSNSFMIKDGIVQTYFRLNTSTNVWSHAIELNGVVVSDFELKSIEF